MDETIRVYLPRKELRTERIVDDLEEEPVETPKAKHSHVKEPESIWEDRLRTLREVLAARAKTEGRWRYKHRWFDIVYNWVIGILVVALFVGLICWGVRVVKENKEARIYATAYAEYEAAAQSAKEAEEAAKAQALAAERASEEYIVSEMTSALSKMYYGIKNFEEKYHYSDADFETYGRCAYNRMLNGSYSDDFATVVFQPEQFLSCSENNPDVEPYHSMAKKHIQKWRSETVAPVSDDYVYAELTPNGVYLKNEFNADGYARRWRAS